MKSRSINSNLAAFLFLILITFLTTIFIVQYCEIFNQFGLDAKKRLLNNPILTFFTTPIFFLISAYLCRKFEPTLAGGGPQNVGRALLQLQKTPNSFDKIKSFLGFHTVIVNSFSSLMSTFGGGALGREGPSMQMSAAIFAASANKLKSFFPKIALETWIYVGSGAGLAIAFNAPIAGFAYVMEKLLRVKSPNNKNNIIWTSLVVIITATIIYDLDPLFSVAIPSFKITLSQLSFIILTAIICGFAAQFLRIILHYSYLKTSKIKSKHWFLIPITAGFIVSIISYYSGIYSFSGGIITTDIALLSPDAILSYKEVLGRFANTILTAASGCAGGLVAPAITLGTGIGSIISSFTDDINNKILMLSGLAAFLSVMINRPVTAAIIALEITKQSVFGLPFLLLSATISYLISLFFNKKYSH